MRFAGTGAGTAPGTLWGGAGGGASAAQPEFEDEGVEEGVAVVGTEFAMFGAEVSSDLGGGVALVVSSFREADGERANLLRGPFRRERADDVRIDRSGKEQADGHFGHQTLLHGRAETRDQLLARLGVAAPSRGDAIHEKLLSALLPSVLICGILPVFAFANFSPQGQ